VKAILSRNGLRNTTIKLLPILPKRQDFALFPISKVCLIRFSVTQYPETMFCYLNGERFMEFVEPIRDKKKITQIKNQLEGAKRNRDLLLFVVGLNTALRISDLLQLCIGSGKKNARSVIRS
jgi:hypothetical protein